MRVLVFARRDAGGSWAHLAALLRMRGIADARVIAFDADPGLRWATDIAEVYDGGQELAWLVDHADAFHFVDLVPDDVALFGNRVSARCNEPGMPVVLQCDERPTFSRARELSRLADAHGWSLATTRPLAKELPAAKLLAPFVPFWRAPWVPACEGTQVRTRKSARTVIATSSRSLRERAALERRVDEAELIARRMPDVRVEIVSNKQQAHALQRRRLAQLVLTGGDGLGRNAFESLAQGVPTFAELSASDTAAWTQLAGGHAPPVVGPAKLEEAMHATLAAGDAQPRLRAWASAVLHPQHWLDACRQWYAPTRLAHAA